MHKRRKGNDDNADDDNDDGLVKRTLSIRPIGFYF